MNRFFHKVSLLFLSAMIFSLPAINVNADALPGARWKEIEGNIFLGGNYIEVGINPKGTFGTTVGITGSGFNSLSTYNYRLGLMVDKDGWNIGNPPTTGDFFLPGSPFESYYIRYKGNVYQTYTTSNVADTFPDGTTFLTTNQSVGNRLQALTTITLPDGLIINQIISFDVNDKFFITNIEIINNTDEDIVDIQYGRIFDPDQDRDFNNTFATYNKVISNPKPEEGGTAMVVARGPKTLEAFFFISNDINARARKNTTWILGSTSSYWIEDTDKPTIPLEEHYILTSGMIAANNLNGYVLKDDSISLITKFPLIEIGAVATTTFISSLDPDITEESLSAVETILDNPIIAPQPDPAPEPEVEQPQPDPEPEPYRPYIPPRLRMDIVGLEQNQETVIIDVHTPFELPSGIVVYENDGRPFPIQNIEIFGEVNPNVLGTYRVAYLYRHHDRGVIRRINFRVVDRIRPEATYEIESVYLGDEWVDDIVITDNYWTEFNVRIEGEVNTDIIGSYLLRYFISDLSNNRIDFFRRINVIFRPGEDLTIPDEIFYIRANEYNQYIFILNPQRINTSGLSFFYQQAEEEPTVNDPNWVLYNGGITTSGYGPTMYLMVIDDEGNYEIREAWLGDFDGPRERVFVDPVMPDINYRTVSTYTIVRWWIPASIIAGIAIIWIIIKEYNDKKEDN